jgi:enterochelin esterase-like enzyme
LAGGRLAARLDDDIAAGRFPTALAVLPDSAAQHDARAGWRDAPHQPVLRSLRTDLLPAVARRFPSADLESGHMAVVGVGRGADGARRLAALDHRFGFVQAIGPVQNHWVGWRTALPMALQSLSAAGFGRSPTVLAPTPALPQAGR